MTSTSPSLFSKFAKVSRAIGADSDIAELRAWYENLFHRFGEPAADVTFTPGQLGPIKGEWVRAPNASDKRTILYFHGGGFVAGSPQTHRALAARLADASAAAIFNLEYRLAPEYGFPAAVRDGIDAYRALIAKGTMPGSIAFAGDGSGGGLALAVLLAVRNAGLAMPACLVAMSPWADLSLSGWSILRNQKSDTALCWDALFLSARHYLKKTNAGDPYASPAFASFTDFPPIMIHAGSAEILRDDASRIGDRAGEAAISVSVEIYDGLGHLFQADPKVPEAKVSLARLGQFIRTRMQRAQSADPA